MRSILMVLLLACAGTAGAAPGDDGYARAVDEYEVCHYRHAMAELRGAAEAGHGPAAQMLGTMLMLGPALFGDQVARNTAEGLRWLRTSASAGNEVARFQLARLSKDH